MKVIALKTFKSVETGNIVQPGQILDYPTARAHELEEGGWVKTEKDSNSGPHDEKKEAKPAGKKK